MRLLIKEISAKVAPESYKFINKHYILSFLYNMYEMVKYVDNRKEIKWANKENKL